MGRQIRLIHSVHGSKINLILKEGLKATSNFDDLGLEMRRRVVYCWLRREYDKMWSKRADHVYVEILVNEDRCRVAEMDFASLAMMYLQGSGGRPRNEEAAHLLAEVYRVTSVPIFDYAEGMFSTPEVLVKRSIGPDCVSLLSETWETGSDTL